MKAYNIRTPFQKVVEFHEKFGLALPESTLTPSQLSEDEQRFRTTCLQEELTEYSDAVVNGDLAEQADALLDLIYFAYGTLHRMGVDGDLLFDMVHDANMRKEVLPMNQRRGFRLEVTKPIDWAPPPIAAYVNPTPNNQYHPLFPHHCLAQDGYTGIISIDGPDASGKTTLAKRLVDLFDAVYLPLEWTPAIEENMFDYRMAAITLARILAKDRVVVMERAWLSNPIYSKMFRPNAPQDDWRAWQQELQRAELGLNLVEICALPSDFDKWLAVFRRMCKERNELYGDYDDRLMQQVYWAFHKALYNAPEIFPEAPDYHNALRFDMSSQNTPFRVDEWILRLISGDSFFAKTAQVKLSANLIY